MSDGIFIRPPGSCPGWDLGVPWGVGGGQKKIPEIQPDLVCELLTLMAMALGRGQKFNFLNMVMWHIKLKGMSSRPRYTEMFLPTIKLVTLGWGQRVNYH